MKSEGNEPLGLHSRIGIRHRLVLPAQGGDMRATVSVHLKRADTALVALLAKGRLDKSIVVRKMPVFVTQIRTLCSADTRWAN